MSAQRWLQAELRLLYEYGEHEDFQRDAHRILAGLIRFASKPPTVTLGDELDQAGVHHVRMSKVDGKTVVTPGTN